MQNIMFVFGRRYNITLNPKLYRLFKTIKKKKKKSHF